MASADDDIKHAKATWLKHRDIYNARHAVAKEHLGGDLAHLLVRYTMLEPRYLCFERMVGPTPITYVLEPSKAKVTLVRCDDIDVAQVVRYAWYFDYRNYPRVPGAAFCAIISPYSQMLNDFYSNGPDLQVQWDILGAIDPAMLNEHLQRILHLQWDRRTNGVTSCTCASD